VLLLLVGSASAQRPSRQFDVRIALERGELGVYQHYLLHIPGTQPVRLAAIHVGALELLHPPRLREAAMNGTGILVAVIEQGIASDLEFELLAYDLRREQPRLRVASQDVPVRLDSSVEIVVSERMEVRFVHESRVLARYELIETDKGLQFKSLASPSSAPAD
jgi:hypothetical protein